MKWKKFLTRSLFVLLAGALGVSMFYNYKFITQNRLWHINYNDANTRPTYNDYHHIKAAQQLATGKGVKVGILGKYFGYDANRELFAGGVNFTGDENAFREVDEHGLWMATTLREIAPDAEIYALNARSSNRSAEKKAIVQAVDWAIENNIDILTYSAQAFRDEDRDEIDRAMKKAIGHGIITTLIHYNLPENILPWGFLSSPTETYKREPDVNIYHFDYNMLLLFKYEKFLANGSKRTGSWGDLPHFSNSSMSPVLAGIVAMMREIDPQLSPAQIKNILIKTSYTVEYEGNTAPHVVDAEAALQEIIIRKSATADTN